MDQYVCRIFPAFPQAHYGRKVVFVINKYGIFLWVAHAAASTAPLSVLITLVKYANKIK
jgi:hypothetical protein